VIVISAVDPLNLVGVITAGERIRTAIRTRLAYRDGTALAVKEGDVVRQLTPLDSSTAHDVDVAMQRRRGATGVLVNRESLITNR
jgi:ATP-dependent Lhr-like helicase